MFVTPPPSKVGKPPVAEIADKMKAGPSGGAALASTSGQVQESIGRLEPNTRSPPISTRTKTAEARAIWVHAKTQLDLSGNIKTIIKKDVLAALKTLYEMVKQLDAAPVLGRLHEAGAEREQRLERADPVLAPAPADRSSEILEGIKEMKEMLRRESEESKGILKKAKKALEDAEKLSKREDGPTPSEILAEIKSLRQIVVFDVVEGQKVQHNKCPTSAKIDQLETEVKKACAVMRKATPAAPADCQKLQEGIESLGLALNTTKSQLDTMINTQRMSYADMARKPVLPTPNHALIVSSSDQADTSSEVLEKIRGAVDARSTGIRVDMVRKARDQKVVIGCKSQEEVQKLQKRLQSEAKGLKVEEAKTKDPYVIIRDVLSYNTDEEVEKSLKTQNPQITGDIPEEEYRATVKYRRRARNPLESHIILQVSPKLWQRLTMVGMVHVDLQRRPVSDQSPLLQCTKCLGFGHGRRFCKVAVDLCSHCGEQHLRKDCPAWTVGDVPSCRNCRMANLDRHDHSAYDMDCPIRRRWDSLARSSVAYC